MSGSLAALLVASWAAVAGSLHVHTKGEEYPFGDFIVRYAFLDPSKGTSNYLTTTGASMIKSSICLSEKNLAPTMYYHPEFQTLPRYMIYTDNTSQPVAESIMTETFPSLVNSGRVQYVNLDADPDDEKRMKPYLSLNLDAVNFASVRRTVADTAHLPSSSGRLLLGTDVSFLSAPSAFLSQAALLPAGRVLYMVDDETFEDHQLYSLRDYVGPQCPGLLGDFIYMSPGTVVTTKNLQEKLIWYGQQPVQASRTSPPCELCTRLSEGMHGIDQFALVLALGEAVAPDQESIAPWAPSGCIALSTTYYKFNPEIRKRFYPLEAVHDKYISTCASSS